MNPDPDKYGRYGHDPDDIKLESDKKETPPPPSLSFFTILLVMYCANELARFFKLW